MGKKRLRLVSLLLSTTFALSSFGAPEPRFDDTDASAALMAYNVEDGSELALHPLDTQPAFDGMAAAKGRLYMSMVGGTIVCLGA